MKNRRLYRTPRLLFSLLCAIIFVPISHSAGQPLFTRGVNLTGWFQASSPGQIQFSRYSKKDFENIRNLGCDVVRLPINLHAMTSGHPDYLPDPLFLNFLDEVVTWAEELNIHLILDNHTFDPASNTDPAIEEALVKVWSHMASYYKDRSEFLYYEVLNEPHGIDDAVWSAIQQKVIDAIRAQDLNHYIIVGPANWNSYHNLRNLPVYTDPKLIYTFHFYDPFVFTHQGASWTDPSMVPLAGVPFPYRSSDMPATPASLKGTWIESALHNYSGDGSFSKVRQLIDIAAQFKAERSVPVFCGEFGVYIPNSPEDDRVDWYRLVQEYLKEKGIPWTAWDYQGGFGLFEKNSPEYFDHDLNTALLEALGLTPPVQTDYVKKPLLTGFDLYSEGIGRDITNASSIGSGQLDFYSRDNPMEGDFCIYWTGVGQYDPIAFDFNRHLDLSRLKDNQYSLEFYVRGLTATMPFDVRFIDSRDSGSDRPWRMGITLEDIPADDTWRLIKIPLTDLQEKGAWDGSWFPPSGSNFDWRSVDRFEIIPEHQSMEGVELWFDEIRITGEEITVSVGEESHVRVASVYPNPVTSPSARVAFHVERPGLVQLVIHDMQGRILQSLIDQEYMAGQHFISWDRGDLPPGLYLLKYRCGKRSEILKVVVSGRYRDR